MVCIVDEVNVDSVFRIQLIGFMLLEELKKELHRVEAFVASLS